MPKRTRDHQSWLVEKLTDPVRAAAYLNAAMEDSKEMFLEALRDVAQARQMAKVARDAGVTRESLYRATSDIGNPTLDTLVSVLSVMGIKIVLEADSYVSSAASMPPSGSVISSPGVPIFPKADPAGYLSSGIGAAIPDWYNTANAVGKPEIACNIFQKSNVGIGNNLTALSMGTLLGFNPEEPQKPPLVLIAAEPENVMPQYA